MSGINVNSGKANPYNNNGETPLHAVDSIDIDRGDAGAQRSWRIIISDPSQPNQLLVQCKDTTGTWTTAGTFSAAG